VAVPADKVKSMVRKAIRDTPIRHLNNMVGCVMISVRQRKRRTVSARTSSHITAENTNGVLGNPNEIAITMNGWGPSRSNKLCWMPCASACRFSWRAKIFQQLRIGNVWSVRIAAGSYEGCFRKTSPDPNARA